MSEQTSSAGGRQNCVETTKDACEDSSLPAQVVLIAWAATDLQSAAIVDGLKWAPGRILVSSVIAIWSEWTTLIASNRSLKDIHMRRACSSHSVPGLRSARY